MRIVTALIVGVLLLGASFGLLARADSSRDVVAVAGGIGIVVGASLLGLTVLAVRWRSDARRYVTSTVDDEASAALYAELARATGDGGAVAGGRTDAA